MGPSKPGRLPGISICGTLISPFTNILGMNAYHGNASAAVVCDGRLIAAVEEERFNRVKYAAGFPAAAIRYCLQEAGPGLRHFSPRMVLAILPAPCGEWARAIACRSMARLLSHIRSACSTPRSRNISDF